MIILSWYSQIEKAEAKLGSLKQGVVLVSADEREKVQEAFVAKMGEWRKRKKMFKELWDIITESLPKDLKEFKVKISGSLFFILDARVY